MSSQPTRTIWPHPDGRTVVVIDQTLLPHVFETLDLTTLEDAAVAIETMVVRGAPLIGVTAAYGMALGMAEDASDAGLERSAVRLLKTRPTAVNLHWAVGVMQERLAPLESGERVEAAYARAAEIADEDAAMSSAIGDHGLAVIEEIWEALIKGTRSRSLSPSRAIANIKLNIKSFHHIQDFF